MNYKQLAVASAFGTMLLGGGMASTLAQDSDIEIDLEGIQEVPVVSTGGSGTFSLNDERDYELVYNNLEGIITQAHIHFGRAGTTGGIMIWLCANRDLVVPPSTSIPECPGGSSGSFAGNLADLEVVEIFLQGIESGNFGEAFDAIDAGLAYVNVHSTRFLSGEVRGQIPPEVPGDSIEELREDLDDLRDDFDGHTHTYLTGKGKGHNNTEATSGGPEF